MSCVSDDCTQGRQPCPTPWLCGKYGHDSDEPNLYVDEPIPSPNATAAMAALCGLAAIAGFIAILALVVWQVAPILVAVWR